MMPRWLSAKTHAPFLFESWHVNSITGIISAMLFSVTLTIVLESVNFELHLRSTLPKKPTKAGRVVAHVISSALRVLSLLLAYSMMLAIMSFNVWMLVCVVVGSGVGHQVIRPLLWMLVETRRKRRQRRVCRGRSKDKEEIAETEVLEEGIVKDANYNSKLLEETGEDGTFNDELIQPCNPHVHLEMSTIEANKLYI